VPIYEYVCSACHHRTDILHGINEEGPTFCPSCGAEGTMRKAFAPPTIHYKGTGWAKKERSASKTKAAAAAEAGTDKGGEKGGDKTAADSSEKASKPETAASSPSSDGGD
jgi:putative FmdB family regulatory protein